jgi:hypothetical protein
MDSRTKKDDAKQERSSTSAPHYVFLIRYKSEEENSCMLSRPYQDKKKATEESTFWLEHGFGRVGGESRVKKLWMSPKQYEEEYYKKGMYVSAEVLDKFISDNQAQKKREKEEEQSSISRPYYVSAIRYGSSPEETRGGALSLPSQDRQYLKNVQNYWVQHGPAGLSPFCTIVKLFMPYDVYMEEHYRRDCTFVSSECMDRFFKSNEEYGERIKKDKMASLNRLFAQSRVARDPQSDESTAAAPTFRSPSPTG